MGRLCRLWVISGGYEASARCRLWIRKQTFGTALELSTLSTKGHKRTFGRSRTWSPRLAGVARRDYQVNLECVLRSLVLAQSALIAALTIFAPI